MLSLSGTDEVIKNLYRIARLHAPNATIETTDHLRQHYLGFLEARQSHAPVNWRDDVFVCDDAVESKLREAFCYGLLNDMDQADVFGDTYRDDVRQQKLSIARAALARLLQMDDAVALVFGLTIHSIFVRAGKPTASSRGSHGGSSSAAIGTIWLTIEDSVRPIDIMEMYIHEMTHHLLFIDELTHAQFDYAEIAKPENFARSAILRRNRPLDKVVHSIVVSTEILAARRSYLGDNGKTTIHPASEALVRDTIAAAESVAQLPNINSLVTPHIRRLLTGCVEFCTHCIESIDQHGTFATRASVL